MNDGTEATGEAAGAVRSMLLLTLVVGMLLSTGAALLFGLRALAGVALGVAIAGVNLAMIARVVRSWARGLSGTVPWTIVGLLKIGVLFGGLYLLVRSGIVDVLPLAAGYGALPLGIFVSQLRPSRALGEGS